MSFTLAKFCFTLTFYVLLCLLSNERVQANMFLNDKNVMELTASNFQELVMDNEHTVMVKFYAPWCGHCQRLHPEYSNAAVRVGKFAKLAAIDCDAHGALCSKYGIKGFPTLKVFHTMPLHKRRSIADYSGQRDATSIASIVKYYIPNHVKKIGSQKDQMSMTAFFQMGNTTLPKLLVIKQKATPTNELIRHLAIEYRYRLLVGEHVDASYSSSSIYLISPTSGTIPYQDQIQLDKLMEFVKPYALKQKLNLTNDKPKAEQRDEL